MSERLTKDDWLRLGLRTLVTRGPGALQAAPMAAKLKVSRGSFYWHFRDIADFRAQLLQSWRERATDQVILDLGAGGSAPDQLKALLTRAFDARARLDRAIRAWAAEDKSVAEAVAAVDAKRIDHIAGMLRTAGVADETAQHRAAFLYWAYLGQALVMDRRHRALTAAAIDDIVRMFEG